MTEDRRRRPAKRARVTKGGEEEEKEDIWGALVPEMQDLIRRCLLADGDFVSLASLRMTCRRERTEGYALLNSLMRLPVPRPIKYGSRSFIAQCIARGREYEGLLAWARGVYPRLSKYGCHIMGGKPRHLPWAYGDGRRPYDDTDKAQHAKWELELGGPYTEMAILWDVHCFHAPNDYDARPDSDDDEDF